MKKTLKLMLAMIMILTLVACTSNNTNEEPSGAQGQVGTTDVGDPSDKLAKIQESKTLVLGVNANYPPFIFHAQVDGKDEIVGMDKMVLDYIAEKMGVELEIQDMDFQAVLQGAESGMVDVAAGGINSTEERAQVMDFTKEFFHSDYCVLVREEDADMFDTPDKLGENSARLGVQTATVQEEMASSYQGVEVISLAKTPDLVLQLQSGMIDAILTENSVADLYAATNEGLISQGTSNFDGPRPGVALAVAKGNEDLLAELNLIIDELIDQDKIQEFYQESLELAETQVEE